MFILIPIGGRGERFRMNGYLDPKALIKIMGHPILYYLLDNLNLKSIDFVCIAYNDEYDRYFFEDQLKKDYPGIKFRFVPLIEQTRGAAETLNVSLKALDIANEDVVDSPVLCLDCDNFYTADIIDMWKGENAVFCFEDKSDSKAFSFIDMSPVNRASIQRIVEKERISSLACTGAYGFHSAKELLLQTQDIIDNLRLQKGEFYTSNVIQNMLDAKHEFNAKIVSSDHFHCLGTPTQVKLFYNNFPKSCSYLLKKKRRFCFDLDNTLVTFPTLRGDYSTVRPIEENILFLKHLKSFGHTIIIHTARRMKTHAANIGSVMADIGLVTLQKLKEFDVPFDEIYFGKPEADVYIDDKALNCRSNMEKQLGFFMDTVVPRDFNSLRQDSMELFTKSSEDLSGEIFFYGNIPVQIKDLFPIMVDYDKSSLTTTKKWFSVQKIKGLTLTNIYLSGLLNAEKLLEVMQCILRIQSCPFDATYSENVDIYANYSAKLCKRHNSFDYSKYDPDQKLFTLILAELEAYESKNLGKCTTIHGDCVMTNILMDSGGNLKFIDMRGKVGEKLTICGDWLYDWAKLYQSLVGYDKILMNKTLNENYEKTLLVAFEDMFVEMFSSEDLANLKIITKSLLYTLIPLHNNEKCKHYLNLISRIK